MESQNQIEERKPRERVEGESDKAYGAFVVYLEKESLTKVADNFAKPSSKRRQLQRWSSENNWVERKQKYTSHIQNQAFLAIEGKAKASAAVAFDYLHKALTLDIGVLFDDSGTIKKPHQLPEETRRIVNNYVNVKGKTGTRSHYDLANKETVAKTILTMAGLLGNKQPLTQINQTQNNQYNFNDMPIEKVERILAIIDEPDKKNE